MVEQVLREKSRKFGIQIGDEVNVGNHLHLKIKISSRENFQKFLKSITTLIARKITGAKRGKKFGRFWQGLAFTRVLKSYAEEIRLGLYFDENRVEAAFGPKARQRMLDAFNEWIHQSSA
jgi:hypothetical protein